MKRILTTITTLLASVALIHAQEVPRGFQQHVDFRSEVTIETFIVGAEYTAGYRFNNFIFVGLGTGYHHDIYFGGYKTAPESDFDPILGKNSGKPTGKYKHTEKEVQWFTDLTGRKHIFLYMPTSDST